MPEIISGGVAKNAANVGADGRLAVRAVFNSEFDDAIEIDEQGYTLSSNYSTGGTNEEVIYIKNTSTTLDLHIDTVEATADAAGLWTLFRVTSGTAAGSTIIPTNMKLASPNAAAVTAFGDASVTGTLTGTEIAVKLGGANSDVVFTTEGFLSLGQNEAIALTYATTSQAIAVTIYFHFRSD